MRFDFLRARAIGPFKDIAIDFRGLPGDFIALTGVNGEGKSLFLELLLGALDRKMPTRGTVGKHATARDSFLEVGVTNGSSHVLRHTFDAVSGGGEALAIGPDGQPYAGITAGIEPFLAWRSEHLPPTSVLLASSFTAQKITDTKSGNFLDLSRAQRKAVVLSALGIEHYEGLSQQAGQKLLLAQAAVVRLGTQIAALRLPVPLATLEEDLVTAKKAADYSSEVEAKSRLELSEAESASQDAGEAQRHWQRQVNERNQALAEVRDLQAKLDAVAIKIANNQAVLSQREEIDQAVAELAAARAEIDSTREKEAAAIAALGELHDAEERAGNDLRFQEERCRSITQALESLKARAARAMDTLKNADAVETAQAALPDLEEKYVAALKARDAAIVARYALDQTASVGLEKRVENLRGGLGAIAVFGADTASVDVPVGVAKATLESDDKNVEAARLLPQQRAEARRAVELATADVDATGAKLNACKVEIAKGAGFEAARTDLRAAEAEIASGSTTLAGEQAKVAPLKTASEAATRARVEKNKERNELAQKARVLEGKSTNLQQIANKAGPLAVAEARIAELTPILESYRTDIAALNGRISEIGELGTSPTAPDLEHLRRRLQEFVQAAKTRAEAVGRAEATLAAAKTNLAEVEALEAERARAEADVSDWQRLVADLGPNGLQALEVDAAGPELTENANALLHTAFGPRFSVRFDTVRRDSKDQKDVEIFDVMVTDSLKNREGEAKTFSGGEGVFIGAAVSLAFTILACKRSGAKDVTLVFDETGAALSEGNGPPYIAMLRRAAQMIGASKTIFVSHSKELQELADARIEIAGGKATVVS